MVTRFVIIKGEPTVEQLLAIEEFNEYHFAFIDQGGTMRVTADEEVGESFKKYAVVEGMNISAGYPTVDAEHIAVYCDKTLAGQHKVSINGIEFDRDMVPARFRHLVDIYSMLAK